MVDGDANCALLGTYRNSIMRYQKLLKTRLTEVERNYIKASATISKNGSQSIKRLSSHAST
jgi:hypothetical protein